MHKYSINVYNLMAVCDKEGGRRIGRRSDDDDSAIMKRRIVI